MLTIRPSAARIQIPMAQQSLSQKLMTLVMTLRTIPMNRKTIFIGIFVCIFIIYIGPFFYRHLPSVFTSSATANSCLTDHLEQHRRAVSEMDAFIDSKDINADGSASPLQFVGNGKLGAVAKDSSNLYLFYEIEVVSINKKTNARLVHKEVRSHKLLYNPMLRTSQNFDSVVQESRKSASVINFREGIVERLNCYQLKSGCCLFLNHTVVAHRSRPNVFLQHLQATVGSEHRGGSVEDIRVMQDEFLESSDFKRVPGNLFNHKSYKLYSAVVQLSSGGYMGVAVALQVSGEVLKATNPSENHIDAVTIVMHSDVTKSVEAARSRMPELQKSTVAYANEVMELSTDELLREHRAAWKDILHTGLTVSTTSKYEPGIPKPSIINATIYYVLSMSDSKLHDKDVPEKERRDLINRLQTPDFCYQGHPTFHGDTLWHNVRSVEDIIRLQQRWVLTLRKQQCRSLVSEGAEGLLQAMLLSFGGLQFTENDLRLGTDPDVLHNDIAFHSLIYRNDTLDIVIKRDTNSDTPVIMVALKEPSKIPLYACEAGCMLDAVELSPVPRALPVYVTDPLTPILFISHDTKHLADLRETLHVRKIVEHAQHMESIRNRTGLPTIFWVGIGSLIVFFHLFLIRLICNEYKASMSTGSSSYLTGVGVGASKSSRYTSRGRLAS